MASTLAARVADIEAERVRQLAIANDGAACKAYTALRANVRPEFVRIAMIRRENPAYGPPGEPASVAMLGLQAVADIPARTRICFFGGTEKQNHDVKARLALGSCRVVLIFVRCEG
jgi:hypothetical protein